MKRKGKHFSVVQVNNSDIFLVARQLSMQQRRRKADAEIAFLGGSALALGISVYLLIRNPQSLYLIKLLRIPESFGLAADHIPRKLISFCASVPTATHAFAFSLFTALALGLSKPIIAGACMLWAVLDVIFEFAQYFKKCPEGFFQTDQWLPQLICAFASGGVFDWVDVWSVLLGAGLAYVTLRRFYKHYGDIYE